MSLDNKYRPRTLDKIIGQEQTVKRLQGIINSKKPPQALLFVGRSSAGKTTMAKAFTASLFGVKELVGDIRQDWHEINASETRGIDDVRELLKITHLKPRFAPKRVILLDEVHGLTGPSADALLKPLENPPPHCLFILGTMEPEKLKQAIRNRCSQFILTPPSKEDMLKYVKRIAKGEEMSYMTEDLLEQVVENSNQEMRTAAHLMEAVQQTVSGTGKKPKKEDILEALESTQGNDDELAVRVLVAIYAAKFKTVQRSLLDVSDYFRFIAKLLSLNTFLLNDEALGDKQHRKVWYSQMNKDVKSGVSQMAKLSNPLEAFATVQQCLVQLRAQSGAFMVPESELISSYCFEAIKNLKALRK